METNLTTALAAIADKFSAFERADKSLNPLKEKKARLERLIASHQDAIGRLDRRLEKEGKKVHAINPWSHANYLEPLAAAMLTQFPGMEAKVRGPYGLGNTAAISIFDPARGEDKGIVGWLQFRRDEGQVGYVDTSKDEGNYSPKSLGALNGRNHPTVPLTADMSLEEIADLFRQAV